MGDARVEEQLRQLQENLARMLAEQAGRSSRAHSQYLESQQVGLRRLAELARLQAGLAETAVQAKPARPVLIDRALLEEFASGSIERCLGPEYARYRDQRMPRIPNGVLLLMDRVVRLDGTRGSPNKLGEIETEYDVPADVWYLQDQEERTTPYSVLMEMALQPCGFLSAYLGSMLLVPGANLFFRNLDGEARLLRRIDLRGKTVTGWARMASHTLSGDTLIQKFQFRLLANGEAFFEGQSVFGFFPEETMLRQQGMDGGKESLPAYLKPDFPPLGGRMLELNSPNLHPGTGLRLSKERLALLDEVFYQPAGGREGKGYVFARRKIRPEDWFFKNHFFQDPVMPGSLGVEAILEALRCVVLESGWVNNPEAARFTLAEQLVMNWKYRGQILPSTDHMFLEVNLRQVENRGNELIVAGDASLWADRIRIYELKQIAITAAW